MKRGSQLLIISFLFIAISCSNKQNDLAGKANPIIQKKLDRVEKMTNNPQPFKILDFNDIALKYDELVFDESQTGKYWPLIWKDDSRKNFDQTTFGIYTAMGDVRQGTEANGGMFHESLATMGAVLGASLVGIDKSNQNGGNYVGMLKNYFNSDTKWNIMMNNTNPEVAMQGGGYARDWWYDVYPNILYYAIADKYPNEKDFDNISRTIADKFYAADSTLNGNYDHAYFDYSTMEGKNSWICNQQDAAAGHAFVLYSAYEKFGDEKYLKGTKSSIEALLGQKKNEYYEILMPFGAYVAARLNAEQGTDYDYTKIMEWSFNGTPECRKGWGVLLDNWNGYDVSGLVGSTVDHGGFAFLMNTYDSMWPLVAMVRYDQTWANTIGKWMLNATNASHLFYPYEIADEHQTIPEWKSETKGVIAYEGLIKEAHFEKYEHIKAPIAIGDGPHWNKDNPDVSQFSVYGSGHVGIAGAIIKKTNISNILQLDLLATDFYRKEAYPSYLYYNPNDKAESVEIDLGEKPVKLYDAISRKIIAKNVSGKFNFDIDKTNSVVLIIIPQKAELSVFNNKLLAGDVVVDYHFSDK